MPSRARARNLCSRIARGASVGWHQETALTIVRSVSSHRSSSRLRFYCSAPATSMPIRAEGLMGSPVVVRAPDGRGPPPALPADPPCPIKDVAEGMGQVTGDSW